MTPRWIALLPLTVIFAQPAPQLSRLEAGVFLVAAENLRDPNFVESVVLLAQYGKSGAMGVIVNRPAKAPVSRLLPSLPEKAGAARVWEGGPVGRNGALALLRSKEKPGEAAAVLDDVYLITERALLEKALTEDAEARRVRVYVGYSGWSPGQLEREVAAGAWHIVPATAALAFDPEPSTLWGRMLRRANSRIASRTDFSLSYFAGDRLKSVVTLPATG